MRYFSLRKFLISIDLISKNSLFSKTNENEFITSRNLKRLIISDNNTSKKEHAGKFNYLKINFLNVTAQDDLDSD